MNVKIGMGAACVFGAVLGLLPARALAEDSAWDRLGKAAGLVAPTPDPPDFVKSSRPATEPAAIPAFAAPPEPRSHVKTPAELKAMDADLENAARRQRGGAVAKPRRNKDAPR